MSVMSFPVQQKSQEFDLVHTHMQSHLRRVAAARCRVDSGPPRALGCTKMRDREKRDRERAGTRRRQIQTKTQREAVDSPLTDACTPTLNTSGTEQAETEKLLCSSHPTATRPLQHLLDTLPLEGEGGLRSRWPLYHTPTGRLTGFLRERQTLTNSGRHEQTPNQPPWKPPYTSPVCSPLVVEPLSDTPHRATVTKSVGAHRRIEGACVESVAEEGSNADDSYSTSWSDASELEDQNGGKEVDGDTRHTERPPSVRDLLLEGAEMRRKTFTLAERNAKAKQQFREKELESSYLQFVSEVTRDILRRSVLTRPALELLCQTHIDRHRFTLREDEMVKRLDKLKRQIGVS